MYIYISYLHTYFGGYRRAQVARANSPVGVAISFNPIATGRTYKVTAKTNLSGGSWVAINGSPPSASGTQRPITDLSANGATKFYHVEITK